MPLPSPSPLSKPLLILFGAILATLPLLAENPAPTSNAMTTGPAPAGKPWEPAWGFWPDYPADWQRTHWGFVEKTKAGGWDVLFLGDSITKNWMQQGRPIWDAHYEPLHALDIGIGGDTTRQTLWRIEHGALDGVQPKVVVLMIGVNNVNSRTATAEEIAKGISDVVGQIEAKLPQAKILLLSVLPVGNPSLNPEVEKVNALLPKLQSGKVRFLDLTALFATPDGKLIPENYKPDQLHLLEQGYTTMDKALYPVLLEMLKNS